MSKAFPEGDRSPKFSPKKENFCFLISDFPSFQFRFLLSLYLSVSSYLISIGLNSSFYFFFLLLFPHRWCFFFSIHVFTFCFYFCFLNLMFLLFNCCVCFQFRYRFFLLLTFVVLVQTSIAGNNKSMGIFLRKSKFVIEYKMDDVKSRYSFISFCVNFMFDTWGSK